MRVDHLTALATEGALLIDALGRVDLDARVPGLEWDARTVATHTGAVHRWAADIVRRRLPDNETGGSLTFWPTGLTDRELPRWLAEGLEALIEELTAAPADLECFTFVPGLEPLTFWRRRQAHETAIHRADVESCAGEVTPFEPEFAQDGLAELVGDFAIERGFASASSGALLLVAADGPAWRVEFGGSRNAVTSGEAAELGPSDVSVTGSSSGLYLWAWNRPFGDDLVAMAGDREVVRLWRDVRVT